MKKITEKIKLITGVAITIAISQVLINSLLKVLNVIYSFMQLSYLNTGIVILLATLLISLLFQTGKEVAIEIKDEVKEKIDLKLNNPYNPSESSFELIKPVDNKFSFDDVTGLNGAEKELLDIVDFLANPSDYEKVGAKLPKGVLLYGPSGTGKTLLAKAMAGVAKANFFAVSGSEFVELFVGAGAKKVRKLFATARESKPAVIFIDEIDALGGTRSTPNSSDERIQTLNQLLIEMDGFENSDQIIVVAATNRLQSIDPALLRSGRFDRRVQINLPDKEGRLEILNLQKSKNPAFSHINWDLLATKTPGFSGADLVAVVNEAAIAAGKNRQSIITQKNIDDALEKIIAGSESKTRLSRKISQRIAYHEAGHALVAYLLGESIDKISIIPRTQGSLGFTISTGDEENQVLLNQQTVSKQIQILLAGQQAERLIYGDISSGASDDLKRATKLADDAISNWGWISPVSFSGANLGDLLKNDRDQWIKSYLEEKYSLTLELLTNNIDLLTVIASELITKETLNHQDFTKIINGGK